VPSAPSALSATTAASATSALSTASAPEATSATSALSTASATEATSAAPASPPRPAASLDLWAAPNQTVVTLFQRQVELRPDQPAIVESNGLAVTYAMLDLGARRVAALLRAQGIGRGQTVGLVSARGVDFYCGLLGIVYAGAVCRPLEPTDRGAITAADQAAQNELAPDANDPAQPDQPIRPADRALAALVVDRWAAADGWGLVQAARPVVNLSDPGLMRQPADPPAPTAVTDPAVVFAAPTAGQPTPTSDPDFATSRSAAIWLTHADIVALAQTAVQRLDLQSTDRIAAQADPTTLESVWDWASALLSGATLVTRPNRLDFDQLRQHLTAHSTAVTLPAALAAWCQPLDLRVVAAIESPADTSPPASDQAGPSLSGHVSGPDFGGPPSASTWAEISLTGTDLGWPVGQEPTAAARWADFFRFWPGVVETAGFDCDGQVAVYLTGPASLDPAALLSAVSQRLGQAPTALYRLDTLPRTADGEVDRRALPGLAALEPTVTPAEAAVQAAFSVALANAPTSATTIDLDTDFVAHGGDSRALVTLREYLATAGWTVTAIDVLTKRTPRAIAARLRPLSALPTEAGARPAVADPAELDSVPAVSWADRVKRAQQADLPLSQVNQAAFETNLADFEPICLRLGLNPEQTDRLLHQAGAAYRTTVPELMIAAVVRAAHEVFGLAEVALTVDDSHSGTGPTAADLPPTTADPTAAQPSAPAPLDSPYPLVVAAGRTVSAVIVAAKEAHRAVPDLGHSYQAWCQASAQSNPDQPVWWPHLAVRWDTTVAGNPVSAADGQTTAWPNPAVTVLAGVVAGQLELTVTGRLDWIDEPTAWRLLVAVRDSLDAIIEHTAAQPPGLTTASDIGPADVDDRVIAQLNALADDPRLAVIGPDGGLRTFYPSEARSGA
jgi:hypothetical protein